MCFTVHRNVCSYSLSFMFYVCIYALLYTRIIFILEYLVLVYTVEYTRLMYIVLSKRVEIV